MVSEFLSATQGSIYIVLEKEWILQRGNFSKLGRGRGGAGNQISTKISQSLALMSMIPYPAD